VAAQVNDELVDRLEALEKIAETITPAMISNPAALQTMLEDRPILLSLINNGVAVTGVDGTVVSNVPFLAGRIGANFMERDYIIGPLKEGNPLARSGKINRTLVRAGSGALGWRRGS
jgi:hypothetical protein